MSSDRRVGDVGLKVDIKEHLGVRTARRIRVGHSPEIQNKSRELER